MSDYGLYFGSIVSRILISRSRSGKDRPMDETDINCTAIDADARFMIFLSYPGGDLLA